MLWLVVMMFNGSLAHFSIQRHGKMWKTRFPVIPQSWEWTFNRSCCSNLEKRKPGPREKKNGFLPFLCLIRRDFVQIPSCTSFVPSVLEFSSNMAKEQREMGQKNGCVINVAGSNIKPLRFRTIKRQTLWAKFGATKLVEKRQSQEASKPHLLWTQSWFLRWCLSCSQQKSLRTMGTGYFLGFGGVNGM